MWLLPSILVSLIHIQPTITATVNHGLHLLPAQNLTVPPAGSLFGNVSPSHPLNEDQDVECHRITEPPMPGLSPTNCESAAKLLCQTMRPRKFFRNRWEWAELVGCATGFYISRGEDYSVELCEAYFEIIIEKCAWDSRFNAGTLNVEVLPNFTHAGEPELPLNPMYLMAPERLTL